LNITIVIICLIYKHNTLSIVSLERTSLLRFAFQFDVRCLMVLIRAYIHQSERPGDWQNNYRLLIVNGLLYLYFI